MKKILLLLAISILLVSCMPNYVPTKNSLELQAIQAREFETTKKIAFASTLSVLLDLGYTITSSDIETGYISAKGPTQNSTTFGWYVTKESQATAFIEEITPGKTKVRMGFVNSEERTSAYGAKRAQDYPVEDASIYNNAFIKIQEAIFIRSAIN